MDVRRVNPQKDAKGPGTGCDGFNRCLKSNPRTVEGTREQLRHDRLALFFVRCLIFHREITRAMTYFNILTIDLHRQIVKPAVGTVFGRIKTQRVADFGVGYRGTYRPFKIVVEVKGTAASLVREPEHHIGRRIRLEAASPSWRIGSSQAMC